MKSSLLANKNHISASLRDSGLYFEVYLGWAHNRIFILVCHFQKQERSSMAHYKGAASEGTRAVNLMKRREKAKEELEKMKQRISEVSLSEPIYQAGWQPF